MTDEERIERLESVLALLITWLHRELGTQAASNLLEALTQGDKP